MADSDQRLCTRLVKSVRKHPCLYNFNLPEYSNKIALENAWAIVAKETGMSVLNCKDKWRNIRTVFSRNVKRRRFGEVKRKPYYLQEVLRFLVPYVKAAHPTSTGHNQEKNDSGMELNEIKEEPEVSDDERVPVLPSFSETNCTTKKLLVSTSSTHSTSSITPSQSDLLSEKRITNSENDKSDSSKNETYIDFRINQNGSETTDNSRKMFLLSLLHDVDSMTDLQYRKFRIEVLTMMDNILMNNPYSQEPRRGEQIIDMKIEIEENEIKEE